MIKRIALTAAAIAALAAAAGVCVVSLAYAIFALARIWLIPPAAAAVVTLVFALAIGLGAAVLSSKGKRGRHKPEASPVDRMVELARRKPLLAGAVAVVASFVALRNPAMASNVAMGLLAPKPRH